MQLGSLTALAAGLLLTSCTLAQRSAHSKSCPVEWMVLGVAQDAGIPQIGNAADKAWKNRAARRLATSAALIDHRTNKRFLFEATPDMRAQLQRLDEAAPSKEGPLGLAGVFVTHAHIGHYAGLMFAGVESANTKGLIVYAMPRMTEFLKTSGPWSQLVSAGNITLAPLTDAAPVSLGGGLSVTPLRVPHRDEFSETVGYVIASDDKSVLFVPDIDAWNRWEKEFGRKIESFVSGVDYAYIDATFYDDNELPGRDMSKIPHPRVTETIARFSDAPPDVKARIRFIHFNHTNPLRDPSSREKNAVRAAGFGIAEEGERVCLVE